MEKKKGGNHYATLNKDKNIFLLPGMVISNIHRQNAGKKQLKKFADAGRSGRRERPTQRK
jgi:hypothetical protein